MWYKTLQYLIWKLWSVVFWEPEAQGSGTSFILYHAFMKIGILYEKMA